MHLDDEPASEMYFWQMQEVEWHDESLGDVTLDTICIKNNYNLYFIAFVDVNHHGQSILL